MFPTLRYGDARQRWQFYGNSHSPVLVQADRTLRRHSRHAVGHLVHVIGPVRTRWSLAHAGAGTRVERGAVVSESPWRPRAHGRPARTRSGESLPWSALPRESRWLYWPMAAQWIRLAVIGSASLAFACSDANQAASSRVAQAPVSTSASGGGAPRASAQSPLVPASASPTIVKIRTRDHVMTVIVTGSGPRIDVATRDGSIIAKNVNPEDLDRHVPGLSAAYRESIAADGRVDGARLKLLRDAKDGLSRSAETQPSR